MRIITSIIAAFGLLSAPMLLAQEAVDASPVSLELRVEKEVVRTDSNGQPVTELVAAEKVLPGDTVVYTITYTNSGDVPADDVVINNPVPAEVVYIEGSAIGEGAQIEFSVDGETFGTPAELVVRLPGGTTRPADPAEYRVVRWTLAEAIPANSSGFVQYRALLR